MPKNEKIIIKAKDVKARLGHISHKSGSGYVDSRPKRLRTRNSTTKKAIKEYD